MGSSTSAEKGCSNYTWSISWKCKHDRWWSWKWRGEVEVDESNKDDLTSTAIDEETDPIDCAVCAFTTQYFCVGD